MSRSHLLARGAALLRSPASILDTAMATSSYSLSLAVADLASGKGAMAALASSFFARSMSSTSTSSSSTTSPSSSTSAHDHDKHLNHHHHLHLDRGQAHVNALLYRARQRGFLELDLLLGGWADRNARELDAAGRAALEELLELDNPDLFAWLTAQADPPREVAENAAFRSIAADVAERLHAHRPDEARSKDGAKWVRGWDDIKEGK